MTAIIMLAVLSTLMAAFLNTASDDSWAVATRSGRFEIKRSASSVNRLAAQSVGKLRAGHGWCEHDAAHAPESPGRARAERSGGSRAGAR